ncbi:MAG: 2-dehydro-3-deoxygalactonokinase [Sphingomonas sp.]|uniref:2-dehydro-3-deoxygalactonokinase n=1 Tax=Sphingomonas sp. TaxID=28214 RepID=UPI003F7D5A1D
MKPDVRLLAIDWGTTTRRVFAIAIDGSIVSRRREPLGVLRQDSRQCQALVDALKVEAAGGPILLSGMIGSDRGLGNIPYVACPASMTDLAKNAVAISDRVRVVPGVSLREGRRCDVMRGEEAIILGAVAADLIPSTCLICQPGTHNKWVRVENGAIRSFRTVMTGEMFDLLRARGVLAPLLSGKVEMNEQFAHGVKTALNGHGMLADLFSIRARAMLDGGDDYASFASGLLIGDDVRIGLSGGDKAIVVLGSGTLSELYRSALRIAECHVQEADAELAFASAAATLARCWGWM